MHLIARVPAGAEDFDARCEGYFVCLDGDSSFLGVRKTPPRDAILFRELVLRA
jgi:hypothetical protein